MTERLKAWRQLTDNKLSRHQGVSRVRSNPKTFKYQEVDILIILSVKHEDSIKGIKRLLKIRPVGNFQIDSEVYKIFYSENFCSGTSPNQNAMGKI